MTTLNAYVMTNDELNAIGVNGCGSKGGWFKVPNFCWKPICNKHDAAYWIGGDNIRRQRFGIKINIDRLNADNDMLGEMLVRCDEDQLVHILAAHSYYWAVRLFGAKHFNQGAQRTRAELDMAVNEYHRQQRMR